MNFRLSACAASLTLAMGLPLWAQDVIVDLDAIGRLGERLLGPDGREIVQPPIDFDALVNRPTEGPVFVYGTRFRKTPGDEFERGEVVLGIPIRDPITKGVQMARLPYETVSQTPVTADVPIARTIQGWVFDAVQSADGDLFAVSVYLSVFDQIPGRNLHSEFGYLLIGNARSRRLAEIEAEFAGPSGDPNTDWVNPRNWDHVALPRALETRCAPATALASAAIEAGLAASGSDASYTLDMLDQSYFLGPGLPGFTADKRFVVRYELSYSASFTLSTLPDLPMEVSGTGGVIVALAQGGDGVWRISDCNARLEDVAPLPATSLSEPLSVSDYGVLMIGDRVLTNADNTRIEARPVTVVAGPRP